MTVVTSSACMKLIRSLAPRLECRQRGPRGQRRVCPWIFFFFFIIKVLLEETIILLKKSRCHLNWHRVKSLKNPPSCPRSTVRRSTLFRESDSHVPASTLQPPRPLPTLLASASPSSRTGRFCCRGPSVFYFHFSSPCNPRPRRAPSLAAFGAGGLVGGIYFTDDWIGKNVIRLIPFVGAKYQ